MWTNVPIPLSVAARPTAAVTTPRERMSAAVSDRLYLTAINASQVGK